MSIRNIVILTGAGVSAESGLATFRGPDGLWEGHRVEDVCTPEAFARDSALVHAFYDARRAKLGTVEPNAAHRALARLDEEWLGELLLVTQNVDDLHERAGSKRLVHMHGELAKGWCLRCNERFGWTGPMGEVLRDAASTGSAAPQDERTLKTAHAEEALSEAEVPSRSMHLNVCPRCGTTGMVRPDIVWFGEMPYEMERIDDALRRCDLFVSIGTSGAVYPAAGFVQSARYSGAQTLEMNLEPSLGSYLFHESRVGRAGNLVPQWVDEVLAAA
jgi:NAD-dependent deacetylase